MAKAVRFDKFGGRDVLQLIDVEVPDPGPGRVTVEVRATGLNPGEAAIRVGALEAMFPTEFPTGEGSDFAGVVSQTGDDVTAFVTGDEVLGWTDERAAHAEYVEVPAEQLVRKPAAVPWSVAGSLKVVATTAYAVVEAVGAGEGDLVAVSAAAGGVGSVVVQLLKLRDAEVIGIASETHHDWLRSVKVAPVAYGPGLVDRIRDHAPDGLAAFVDLFGPEYVDLAVDLGIPPERIFSIISFERAGQVGARLVGGDETSTPSVLAEMVNLVAGGLITVPVAATYPLSEVRAAYAELEERHTRGKIVLIP